MKTKRRSFLSKILLWGAGFFVFLAVVINIIRYLFIKVIKEKVWVLAGRVSEMGDELKEFKYGEEVILITKREKKIKAFSTTCPHLGCRVEWSSLEERFRCPCHGAVFDADGKVLSGPTTSPLKKYNLKIEDDAIWLELSLD